MGAPVCNITVQPATAEPQTPRLAAIPVATDLPSALAAIAAIRQNIQAMTTQLLPRGQAFNVQDTKKKPEKIPDFQEIRDRRTVETVRVFNPKDKTQYVDIQQINHLLFENSTTGQQLVWDRPASSGSS